jgi:hypothetical protein
MSFIDPGSFLQRSSSGIGGSNWYVQPEDSENDLVKGARDRASTWTNTVSGQYASLLGANSQALSSMAGNAMNASTALKMQDRQLDMMREQMEAQRSAQRRSSGGGGGIFGGLLKAAGPIVGGIFGGPAGAAVGSAVGGGLGGLFG